jgi:hypothetical protein
MKDCLACHHVHGEHWTRNDGQRTGCDHITIGQNVISHNVFVKPCDCDGFVEVDNDL